MLLTVFVGQGRKIFCLLSRSEKLTSLSLEPFLRPLQNILTFMQIIFGCDCMLERAMPDLAN